MTVYVDTLRKVKHNRRWRWSVSAHMTADTVEELVEFGKRLGLKKSWLQNTYTPHFDLTEGMRANAIVLGAQAVTRTELAEIARKAGTLKWGPKPPRQKKRGMW